MTVAVDNDPGGDGQRAAGECVQRLTQAGVEVITAQTDYVSDLNDFTREFKHGA